MVPPASHGVSRVPWYSGTSPGDLRFSRTGLLPSSAGRSRPLLLNVDFVTPWRSRNSSWHVPQPRYGNACGLTPHRFGLFPVRSPLLGESRLISLPPVTEMFHFTGFANMGYVFTHARRGITPARFPHSEILGSKLARRLPEAYRSQPRPSSPSGAKASTVSPL